MSCALCQRREVATAAQWQALAFCAECLRRFGVFAATGPVDQRSRVWKLASVEPADLAPKMAARVEEGFAALGIDTTKAVADADVHLALGLAYAEMQLVEDAIAEMGQALADPRCRQHERALAVMLDPKVLSARIELALGTLREVLFAN